MVTRPAIERFIEKVEFSDQRHAGTRCLVWTGSTNGRGGYGKFWVGRTMALAHRWAYERWTGPIPEGLTIDHLCRNPPCVNPAHLEAVTRAENWRRGSGMERAWQAAARKKRARTHCKRGHPLSGDNLYLRPDGTGRECRACHSNATRRRRRKGTS